jgi:hypothetical protein
VPVESDMTESPRRLSTEDGWTNTRVGYFLCNGCGNSPGDVGAGQMLTAVRNNFLNLVAAGHCLVFPVPCCHNQRHFGH